MLKKLEKSSKELALLRVISYFNIFDYPLTLLEVFQYLPTNQKTSLSQILNTYYNSSKLQHLITYNSGFFYLRGRDDLVLLRQKKYNLSDQKFKLAKKGLFLLSKLPYLRAIFVCNSLSFNNVRPSSDIDLFLIVAPGRVWLVRLMALFLTELLGLRIHAQEVSDKLCLSFYVDQNNLNLSNIKAETEDHYLNYWFLTLTPIFGQDYFINLAEQNDWILAKHPNYSLKKTSNRRRICSQSHTKKIIEKLLDPVASKFDRLARWLQLKLMSEAKKELARQDNTHVLISDQLIKFHQTDRRQQYNLKYREQLNQLIKVYG